MLRDTGRKAVGVFCVAQQQVLGLELDAVSLAAYCEGGNWLFAEPERLAGVIFELAGGAEFQSQQARGEHGEADVVGGDDRGRIGYGGEGEVKIV